MTYNLPCSHLLKKHRFATATACFIRPQIKVNKTNDSGFPKKKGSSVKKLLNFFVCCSCHFYFSTDVVYKLKYFYDALLLSWTAKEVSKEALSTAAVSTSIEYFHYTLFFPKNPKLTSFKQLDFLNVKKKAPFNPVEVSKQVDNGTHQTM